MGRFVPGFDKRTGNPISRSGYIVTCKRDADCYARCPAHPLTGDRYVCQHDYVLYDVAETTEGFAEDGVSLKNVSQGTGNMFDPEPSASAITGETGICVDVDSSMMQGCPQKTVSWMADSAIGCFDDKVSRYLCGLEVTVADGDVMNAGIGGDVFWPRTLVAGGPDLDGDGVSTPALTCTNPTDCVAKCRFLERTSAHGAGAPATCALCAACPS